MFGMRAFWRVIWLLCPSWCLLVLACAIACEYKLFVITGCASLCPLSATECQRLHLSGEDMFHDCSRALVSVIMVRTCRFS
jgi:hypothetical protein